MRVILNQMVPKLGKEGQIVKVANGYARNYLFPRGLAVVASKGQLSALEKKLARMEAKIAASKASAEELKAKINGFEMKIVGKVAKDSTKLFGAVTAQDITDEINKAFSLNLEKKQIGLLEPIKKLGIYNIQVDLHRDVDAFVTVNVYDPDAPVVLEAVAEETDEEMEAEEESLEN